MYDKPENKQLSRRERIKAWQDVCKLHWKEIISLAIALHWVMDLLIIVPVSLAIGYLFGVHIGHGH